MDVYLEHGLVKSASMEVAASGSCTRRRARPDLTRMRLGTAERMVPGGAIAADICRYAGILDGGRLGRLTFSAHLDATVVPLLADLINTPVHHYPADGPAAQPVVWCGPDVDRGATATSPTRAGRL